MTFCNAAACAKSDNSEILVSSVNVIIVPPELSIIEII